MKTMSRTLISMALLLAGLFSANAAQAESAADDVLRYSTLGLWVSTPLGVSARAGLALPISKHNAITLGGEAGLNGSKQFVGLRFIEEGHGVIWGGLDLARWKTRAHPWLAEKDTDY